MRFGSQATLSVKVKPASGFRANGIVTDTIEGLFGGSSMRHIKRFFLTALVFLPAVALLNAPAARAAGVVSTCDEMHLRAALAGGGAVTFTCSGTITVTSTVAILLNTTIDGTGQNVTISGGNAVGVFSVGSPFVQALLNVSLNNLTIADGNATGVNIFTGGGGGVANYYSLLNVTNTTFIHNVASFWGGGIFNYFGATFVTNSTFIGNAAQNGGGIFSHGGLYVTNSTFFGNAGGSGGGIYNESVANVFDSTFSGNVASFGAGIYNYTGTAITIIKNTIIAHSVPGKNCFNFGAFLYDAGGNLDTDGTCVGTTSPDPLLGPLRNNGGPTQTMAISMASPAFGGGVTAGCPATDQRGVLRPQFLACDIGAFEFATANSLLIAVRDKLLSLIPTLPVGDDLDAKKLSEAASDLSAALNSNNWQGTDGNHLRTSKAEDVFELLTEGATERLTRLLNASPASAVPAQTLQTLLNNLTLAGRTLAATAISDGAGGNAAKLAQANALLAEGDTDAAAGQYVSALVDYEIAWALVQKDE
jgi:hypothetical protein